MENINLDKTFTECDIHLLRMNSAYRKIAEKLPFTAQSYFDLDDDEIEHIDQFLFRFSKLQDAIGQRLFKKVLLALKEDIETMAFIDILNRLEKLQIIDSSNQWELLRELRNSIAHHYDNDPLEMSQALNIIFESKTILESIYQKISSRFKS